MCTNNLTLFDVLDYRPTKELIAKDEGFVKLAEERGWKAERIVRKTDAGVNSPIGFIDTNWKAYWIVTPSPHSRKMVVILLFAALYMGSS